MNCADQPRVRFARVLALLVFAAAACLAGCSKPAPKSVLTAENSNLKPLSILYGKYLGRYENRPPANEAEFKKYIQASEQTILKQFNTDIDKLFVSERDDQPYVVLYRGNKKLPSGVVAFEREGVGGERIVAYPFGVGLVDEVRFQQLVPNPP